ncbi:DNA primase [Tomitella fengzijianii]|uniref:DNA primase n=2 Tax=Tomitella fengzijianii TaxID=2597660 RepID=A0A516X8E7_9ACTN|nr:DNA primase [Tomitella fengzijianii]
MTSVARWAARIGKRPVQVGGRSASPIDPRTWTTFDRVKHLPHGVMLGDGLACLDLDHCLQGDVLAPWAVDAITQLPAGSIIYTERSMSGDGVHVFHRAPEAPGRRRVVGGGAVETYSRARFIAVTGDRFEIEGTVGASAAS